MKQVYISQTLAFVMTTVTAFSGLAQNNTRDRSSTSFNPNEAMEKCKAETSETIGGKKFEACFNFLKNASVDVAKASAGNGAKKCSDTVEKDLDAAKEKIEKARQSCENAATNRQENSDSEGSPDFKQCSERIISCAAKKTEVNEYRTLEEDEEKDTKDIANIQQVLSLAGSNIPIPSSLGLKDNELNETEKEYVAQCPQKSLKEYKEEKKNQKERVKKLEEKIATLNKEKAENDKKLIEEKRKMDEDGAKTAEKLRDESKKTAEKIADLNKDKQKAVREIGLQEAEIKKQQSAIRKEMIKNNAAKKIAYRKLKSKHQIELICAAEYGESLNKGSKGPKTTVGMKGAMHARNVKLEIVSECVRTKFAEYKQAYDLAKDQEASLRSDIQLIQKQNASIVEQKTSYEVNHSKEEQAIRQGEQNAISASQQHQQQKLQSIQMVVQNQQKEMTRLTNEIAKAEKEIKKAEKEEARLGAEPVGETTLADAKAHLGTAKQKVISLVAAAKKEGGDCQTYVEEYFGEDYKVLAELDKNGDRIKAQSKSSDAARKVAGNNPKTDK